MTNKIPAQILSLTMQLARSQPWLLEGDRYLQRIISLFDECANQSQQELILALINRFRFLSGRCADEALSRLANHLFKEMQLAPESVEIAAMGVDSAPDSSQEIVNKLKPILALMSLRNVKLSNRCNKSPVSTGLSNFVLVDEFLGSGQTAEGRIKMVKRQANQKQAGYGDNLKIHVCVLAAMKEGIAHVKEKTDCDVFAVYELDKGISDHYSGEDLRVASEAMDYLESLLADSVGAQPLPAWGYMRSEALYGREGGNIPNNVFPVFWWDAYKDQLPGSRSPMFLRYSYDEAE